MSSEEAIELKKLDPDETAGSERASTAEDGERPTLYDDENRLLRERAALHLAESEHASSDADHDVQRPLLERENLDEPATVEARTIKRVHYGEASAGEQDNLLTGGTPALEETNFGGGEDVENQPSGDRNLINFLGNRLPLDKIDNFMIPVTFVLVVLLIIAITIPICIFRLEYNEMALTRNIWTGSVNYDKVYGPGLHLILPWYEGIIFDKTAQSYHIKEINIFTTDKLSVKTSFTIYYFLDKNKLPGLYRNFATDYKPVIERVSQAVLLNRGLEFSIDDYRTKRTAIQRYLRNALKNTLENGYGVRLLDVYLGRITFNSQINQLNLLRVLNGLYKEKAEHDKQTNITRAETKYKVRILRNEARLAIESARSKAAHQVQRIEEINRSARLEVAHLQGFNVSVSQLGFFSGRSRAESQKQAMSFCYISSLINNENVKFIQKSNLLAYYDSQLATQTI